MLEPFVFEAALLNFAEVEWDEDPEWYTWNQWNNLTGEVYDIPGLGQVTVVDHKSATPVSHDDWEEAIWFVFEFQGTYYRKLGVYTSYSGTEWKDGMTVVEPKTKVVTYYEEA